MAKMQKTLLVVAGVPAVGKSTLLFSCLKGGIKLFGDQLDPLFQSFTAYEHPSQDKDRSRSADALLQGNHWLNDRHLQKMSIAEFGAGNRLIHLDLMARIRLNSNSLSFWCDPSKDSDFFATCFANEVSDFFEPFDVVAVNTVYAPIEECSARFVKRRGNSSNIQTISGVYDPKNLSSALFENVYAGWRMFLLNANVSQRYFTRWNGEKFTVKKVG